jgi:hypothetical protein
LLALPLKLIAPHNVTDRNITAAETIIAAENAKMVDGERSFGGSK